MGCLGTLIDISTTVSASIAETLREFPIAVQGTESSEEAEQHEDIVE